MALRPCPECQREISEQATSCPHCGYSLRPPAATPAPQAQSPPSKGASPTRWGFGVIFGGCLALIAIPVILIVMAGMCSSFTESVDGGKGEDRARGDRPAQESLIIVTPRDRARLCPVPNCGEGELVTRIPTGTTLQIMDRRAVPSGPMSVSWFEVHHSGSAGWVSEFDTDLGRSPDEVKRGSR